MRNLILILWFLPLSVLSQEAESFKRNELKLNAGYLLAGYPEISYERLLSDETGIGLSAGVSIDKDIEFKYSFIPHFRVYFSKKPGAGFFMEGNLAVFAQKGYNYTGWGYSYSYSEETDIWGFGAGFGFGGKFITKSGFIAELLAGVGRNFINNDQIDEAYPRLGVSVGKRF